MKPRWRLLGLGVLNLRALQLLACAIVLLCSVAACAAEEKAHAITVESFVSSLDVDGDGEICSEEANKFLESVLETSRELEDEEGEVLARGTEARPRGKKEEEQDTSMSELITDHNLDLSFSYGGSTISSAEMTDHLSHMLTLDHVVAWVTHGLRLPQYAESFKLNSIDGLDFPTLISDNGSALRDDIGVTSELHRRKIQNALVRQIFGIGRVPSPPQNLACQPVASDRKASGSRPRIMLHWGPPASPGIPPVHKFLVKRRKIGKDGVAGPWAEIGGPAEESFVDSGEDLEFNTEYEYRVQSWGGHGPSDWAKLKGCKAPSVSASNKDEAEVPEKKRGASRAGPKQQICLPSEILALASPPQTTVGRGIGIGGLPRRGPVQGRRREGRRRAEQAWQQSFSLMPAASASAVSAKGAERKASPRGVAAAKPRENDARPNGEELCLPPADTTSTRASPGTRDPVPSSRQASAEARAAGQGQGNARERSEDGGYTGWVVNLGILLLGLLSRSSLLWRAASTFGMVVAQLVKRCVPTEDSSSVVARNFARSINLTANAFQLLSLAVLIALGITTVGHEAASGDQGGSAHGSDRRAGMPPVYPSSFSEQSTSGSWQEHPPYTKSESENARRGGSDSHGSSSALGSDVASSGRAGGSDNSALGLSQARSRSLERGASEGGGGPHGAAKRIWSSRSMEKGPAGGSSGR